jgi:hypothetical protein
MLRICFSETPTEERWILCGRLTAPWVRELRTTWKKSHHVVEGRACIVDLNEITLIDKSGERCLRKLKNEGAEFLASGVYIKHVLEHLNGKRKDALSTLFIGLFRCLLIVLLAASVLLYRPAPRSKQTERPSQASQPAQRSLADFQIQRYLDRIDLGGVNVYR